MLRAYLLVGCSVVALAACAGRDLRGRSTRSPDGRTYLVIADDNGGQCGPLRVDGVVWRHPIGTPGRVRPGDHSITCGSEVAVHVDSGQTYRFDYWGP